MSARFLVAVFLLIGALFTALTGTEYYSWHQLRKGEATVQAIVTAFKYEPCTGRSCAGVPPYRVQYMFRVPGQMRVYSHTGYRISWKYWARVPESVFLTAKSTKKIEVAYSVADPQVNRPAVDPANLAYEWIIWAGFALLGYGQAFVMFRAKRSNNSFKPKPLRGSA